MVWPRSLPFDSHPWPQPVKVGQRDSDPARRLRLRALSLREKADKCQEVAELIEKAAEISENNPELLRNLVKLVQKRLSQGGKSG